MVQSWVGWRVDIWRVNQIGIHPRPLRIRCHAHHRDPQNSTAWTALVTGEEADAQRG